MLAQSEAPESSRWPAGNPPATFWSLETGPISLDAIGGNAHQCSATKLYVGLAKSSDVPKFVRLISTGRTLAHVHIDDPTSGHMIYDLERVVVTGKSVPPAVPQPTFTLQFGAISVTGCGRRIL